MCIATSIQNASFGQFNPQNVHDEIFSSIIVATAGRLGIIRDHFQQPVTTVHRQSSPPRPS